MRWTGTILEGVGGSVMSVVKDLFAKPSETTQDRTLSTVWCWSEGVVRVWDQDMGVTLCPFILTDTSFMLLKPPRSSNATSTDSASNLDTDSTTTPTICEQYSIVSSKLKTVPLVLSPECCFPMRDTDFTSCAPKEGCPFCFVLRCGLFTRVIALDTDEQRLNLMSHLRIAKLVTHEQLAVDSFFVHTIASNQLLDETQSFSTHDLLHHFSTMSHTIFGSTQHLVREGLAGQRHGMLEYTVAEVPKTSSSAPISLPCGNALIWQRAYCILVTNCVLVYHPLPQLSYIHPDVVVSLSPTVSVCAADQQNGCVLGVFPKCGGHAILFRVASSTLRSRWLQAFRDARHITTRNAVFACVDRDLNRSLTHIPRTPARDLVGSELPPLCMQPHTVSGEPVLRHPTTSCLVTSSSLPVPPHTPLFTEQQKCLDRIHRPTNTPFPLGEALPESAVGVDGRIYNCATGQAVGGSRVVTANNQPRVDVEQQLHRGSSTDSLQNANTHTLENIHSYDDEDNSESEAAAQLNTDPAQTSRLLRRAWIGYQASRVLSSQTNLLHSSTRVPGEMFSNMRGGDLFDAFGRRVQWRGAGHWLGAEGHFLHEDAVLFDAFGNEVPKHDRSGGMECQGDVPLHGSTSDPCARGPPFVHVKACAGRITLAHFRNGLLPLLQGICVVWVLVGDVRVAEQHLGTWLLSDVLDELSIVLFQDGEMILEPTPEPLQLTLIDDGPDPGTLDLVSKTFTAALGRLHKRLNGKLGRRDRLERINKQHLAEMEGFQAIDPEERLNDGRKHVAWHMDECTATIPRPQATPSPIRLSGTPRLFLPLSPLRVNNVVPTPTLVTGTTVPTPDLPSPSSKPKNPNLPPLFAPPPPPSQMRPPVDTRPPQLAVPQPLSLEGPTKQSQDGGEGIGMSPVAPSRTPVPQKPMGRRSTCEDDDDEEVVIGEDFLGAGNQADSANIREIDDKLSSNKNANANLSAEINLDTNTNSNTDNTHNSNTNNTDNTATTNNNNNTGNPKNSDDDTDEDSSAQLDTVEQWDKALEEYEQAATRSGPEFWGNVLSSPFPLKAQSSTEPTATTNNSPPQQQQTQDETTNEKNGVAQGNHQEQASGCPFRWAEDLFEPWKYVILSVFAAILAALLFRDPNRSYYLY